MADMPLSLTVKLGSLVVHVQEGIDTGHPFDATAALMLANDPEVKAWLDTINSVYLPERR